MRRWARMLWNHLRPRRTLVLADWFKVEFDARVITISASPPGREAWCQKVRWDTVVRVCFEAEELLISDAIYLFTNLRPESYVVPTEARGGAELWGEILDRRLFDAELAIEAAAATSKSLFCWPPHDS